MCFKNSVHVGLCYVSFMWTLQDVRLVACVLSPFVIGGNCCSVGFSFCDNLVFWLSPICVLAVLL